MNSLAINAIAGLMVEPLKIWLFVAVTAIFAAFGRAIRGVTTSGAIAGAAVCFALMWGAGVSGFAGLCAVFLLTSLATRFGYARKQSLGTAEKPAGRSAAQVLANLAVAASCALFYATIWRDSRLLLAMCAALAEAAADTVSSEIGQCVGATPRLVTSWNKVLVGTDGAVTVSGTLAGIAAALVVSLVFALTGAIPLHSFLGCAVAGVAGTFADSLLGATLERARLIGNNAVNFASTLCAAILAFLW